MNRGSFGLAKGEGRPSVRVYNASAAFSAPNGSTAILTYDTVLWDTHNMFQKETYSSRLTCRVPGRYMLYANVDFPSASYTDVGLFMTLTPVSGAVLDIARMRFGTSTFPSPEPCTAWPLKVGDYVEVNVFQTSGGARTLAANANYSPIFGAEYLGA